MNYVLKSVQVTAIRYEGQAVAELPELFANYTAYTPENGTLKMSRNPLKTLLVPSVAGFVNCPPGDWLVHDGYTLKVLSPKEFMRLYEPIAVESANPEENQPSA